MGVCAAKAQLSDCKRNKDPGVTHPRPVATDADAETPIAMEAFQLDSSVRSVNVSERGSGSNDGKIPLNVGVQPAYIRACCVDVEGFHYLSGVRCGGRSRKLQSRAVSPIPGSHAFVRLLHEECIRIGVMSFAFGDACGHAVLAGGNSVAMAGEVELGAGGKLIRWSNKSGTYHPFSADASCALLPMDLFWRYVDSHNSEWEALRGGGFAMRPWPCRKNTA